LHSAVDATESVVSAKKKAESRAEAKARAARNEQAIAALVKARADEESRRIIRERGIDMFDEDGPTMAYFGIYEHQRRKADREIRAEHERARELYLSAGKPVPSWVLA
jgi:hypothetical protein